jgi:hypothetical protein
MCLLPQHDPVFVTVERKGVVTYLRTLHRDGNPTMEWELTRRFPTVFTVTAADNWIHMLKDKFPRKDGYTMRMHHAPLFAKWWKIGRRVTFP